MQTGEPILGGVDVDPTRVMIVPTVRQAIRSNLMIEVFEHCVANQATCSSKSRV